ncbi:MAG: ABC transporter permease subunit [Opitutales bacterium]|nr:ABC transporter permease subunit [Opitutales bacterium]
MRDYFIRRFLLIPPTIIGITILVFFIARIMPGGPLEQALMQGQMIQQMGEGRQSARLGEGSNITSRQREQLAALYGYDKPWYAAYADWLGDVAQGDLGKSFRYQIPVWQMIRDCLPVSIYYGLATLFITYGVCIPLGIVKAIRHRTWMDTTSSILVFAGYAIPGYVLGALLLLYFSFDLEWFPKRGFIGEDFEGMTLWSAIADPDVSALRMMGSLLWHSALPLCCYMVGSFAVLTMLMKNSLMDNLAADYMRTAVGKGMEFRKAVVKHALRNSLIPIATGFGNNISLFLTGSFLIEKIFNINGFGLLGFNSVVDYDYPVVMGVLLLSSILLLLGNILSDMLVAAVDPRIRFK